MHNSNTPLTCIPHSSVPQERDQSRWPLIGTGIEPYVRAVSGNGGRATFLTAKHAKHTKSSKPHRPLLLSSFMSICGPNCPGNPNSKEFGYRRISPMNRSAHKFQPSQLDRPARQTAPLVEVIVLLYAESMGR